MRDDFTLKTKEQLAKRAGYRCSNPTCNRGTIKPDPSDQASFSNLGVAAHITAASPGGPRYDRTLTPEQRRSVTNGIWLCGTCAKEIDDLVYTEELLRHWKRQAEEATVRAASAAPDEIGRLVEDMRTASRAISTFVIGWDQGNHDTTRRDVASYDRLMEQKRLAYLQEIRPTVTGILTRLQSYFGATPMAAALQQMARSAEVNDPSRLMLADVLDAAATVLRMR